MREPFAMASSPRCRFRIMQWKKVTSLRLLMFLTGGINASSPETTIMQTIQCPRCRHTFLCYAAECPECGFKRPRNIRFIWGPLIALTVSILALIATTLMVKQIIRLDEEPALRVHAKVQAPVQTVANKTTGIAVARH